MQRQLPRPVALAGAVLSVTASLSAGAAAEAARQPRPSIHISRVHAVRTGRQARLSLVLSGYASKAGDKDLVVERRACAIHEDQDTKRGPVGLETQPQRRGSFRQTLVWHGRVPASGYICAYLLGGLRDRQMARAAVHYRARG